MSMICPKCGASVGDAQFCPACGTKLDGEVKSEVRNPEPVQPAPQAASQPVQQKPVQQKPVQQAHPIPVQIVETPPGSGSKYEPVSTAGYFGIILLLSIPIVGFIFSIVWACGGCQKVNKRNLSRAILLLQLIAVIIATVMGLMGFAFTDMILSAM